MRGRAAAARRAVDMALATAWHVVALDRTRRLPKLEKLLKPGGRREIDAEAVLAMMEQLAVRGLVTVTPVQEGA